MHKSLNSSFPTWRLLLTAVLFGLATYAVAAAPSVGEVSLTIGRAVVVSGNGDSVPALRGAKILSGDRVETTDGGHVHIRFIDGALVSVRPNSRLVIEDYQYDPARPALSTVRFRLDQGVTRAISGEAAHFAKERFRLNTPLVAIGVLGTDFVVRTQVGQTLAAVNQGSIILAPFGDGCSRSALGPCAASPSSRYLSADMGRVFAEFRSQFAQLDIKPLPQLQASASQPIAMASVRIDAEPSVALPRESFKQDSAATAVTATVVQGALRKAISDDLSASLGLPPAVAIPPGSVIPPVIQPVVVPPIVVVPPVVVIPVGPAQLAWGRWGSAGGDTSDFSVSLAAARKESRQVTVGNDNYILYRIEPTSGANVVSIASPVGPAFNFSLQQAYAQLATPTLVVPATVTGGTLSIDFVARQFATSLNINSVPTGAIQLAGVGNVRSDGVFIGTTEGQRIAGAMAVDTKSAGYFFEKFTNGALLSGITTWGR